MILFSIHRIGSFDSLILFTIFKLFHMSPLKICCVENAGIKFKTFSKIIQPCFIYRLPDSIVPKYAAGIEPRTVALWHWQSDALTHKVQLEYHSICPLVRIGTPQPFSSKPVCTHRNQRGGGHTRQRDKGGGVTIRTTGEKA